jgi:hypothetical protein
MRAEAEGPARIEKRPRLERGAGGKPGAAGPPSEGERGRPAYAKATAGPP